MRMLYEFKQAVGLEDLQNMVMGCISLQIFRCTILKCVIQRMVMDSQSTREDSRAEISEILPTATADQWMQDNSFCRDMILVDFLQDILLKLLENKNGIAEDLSLKANGWLEEICSIKRKADAFSQELLYRNDDKDTCNNGNSSSSERVGDENGKTGSDDGEGKGDSGLEEEANEEEEEVDYLGFSEMSDYEVDTDDVS